MGYLDRATDSDSSSLPEGEVHIWRASLDVTKYRLEEFRQVLSPDEQKRADRFRFEEERRRCVVAPASLRLPMGQLMDKPAKELTFEYEYDRFGKPHVIQGQGRSLQFNLHSGRLILLAITMRRRIGVDIEMIRSDLELDAIAVRFFTVREYTPWASLTGEVKTKRSLNVGPARRHF